jgi:dihydrofolate synthase/folylpolyglutamate synthase
MLNNEYQKTIDWLFEQFPSYQLIGSKAYKPTLENISLLCEHLGNPEKKLKFIHIAGTNGKGSCSAMLASILTESGEKVGLFTSPHIIDFRERIRVNGQMITESEVINFVKKIKSFDLSFEPSFFEITFAMALVHFYNTKCTLCVIETGLGGRLDATNIIQPLVSLITNISLEHTHILGNTLEEIAGEKAGIIKPETPVVIGSSLKETEEVFIRKSSSLNAPIHFISNKIAPTGYQLPLLGSYQNENLRSVLEVLSILQKDYGINVSSYIQSGLDHLSQNTGFFGRMQIIRHEPLVIFDVSHNLEGIRATLNHVSTGLNGELHILYGSSSDKDVEPILALFPDDSYLHLTSFRNARSLSPEQLTNLSRSAKGFSMIHTDAKKGLEIILSKVKKQDTVLVLGSFFLLSDLMSD